MFSCRLLIWILFIWSQLFTYTYFTYLDFSTTKRVIPLVILCLANIICSTILVFEKVVKYTKTIFWMSSWFSVICIGLILYTLNIIDDVFINVYITVFSIIASFAWCITSHAEKKTEPGLHWYIWSLAIFITICSAFHPFSDAAVIVYTINCIIISLLNIVYLVYTCQVQPSGKKRCRQLWRISACFLLSLLLLIGSILHHSGEISSSDWGQYILIIEGIILFLIVVDFMIGFQQNRIYTQLPSNEHDVI